MKPISALKKIACSVATLGAYLAIFTIPTISGPVFAASTTVAAAATDPVEFRIKELHDKLKITTDQETSWSTVTKEMRDHALAAQNLIGVRNQKASQMTAIDDLQSYAEIAQLHADGMKQFLGVFSPLYASMSDTQKKNADNIFREHKDVRTKKHQTELGMGKN